MRLHRVIPPALLALLVILTTSTRTHAADNARLLPVGATFDVGPPIGISYSRACEEMLFEKRNWLLRYYSASESVTTGLSITNDGRGRYRVSARQARPELYSVVANAFYRKLDLHSALAAVKITQADSEIPQAVALAVYGLWGSLLSNVRSDQQLRDSYILSPQVILYAKSGDGKILQGKMPPAGLRHKNLAIVEDVVDDLLKVCVEPERNRKSIFVRIEQNAAAFSRK